MKYLFIALILIPTDVYPEAKPTSFAFTNPKVACSLLDGKLILGRAWPFGNWEDCAYAVLSVAQQLDSQKDAAIKQLAEEKSKQCLGPVQEKK